ncbi:hypothetical protein [Gordonia iterans]
MSHIPAIPRKALLSTLLGLLLALAVTLSLATAEVAAAPPSGDVRGTVQRNADHVVVTIANGSVDIEDGYLVVRSKAGRVVDKYNLTFVAPDGAEHDVAATVNGATATLTPSKVARTEARKRKPGEIVCGPQTRAQRDQEALQKLGTELGIAATIGGLIGVAVGAVLTLVTGPGVAVGAPLGALIGAGIGLGGAAANGAFDRYFRTINSPFKRQYC